MKKKFSSLRLILRILLVLLFASFAILMIPGCYYYKVSSKMKFTANDLQWMKLNDKYLILHAGDSAWHLKTTGLTGERFSGLLAPLPADRQQYHYAYHQSKALYKVPPPKQLPPPSEQELITKRYKENKENLITDQVHLYLPDSSGLKLKTGDRVEFAYSLVSKVDSYVKDKARTGASIGASIFFGTIGVVAVVVGVVAAISSCPFIYVENDQSSEFAGEIFGGAVYSSLERNDYLPLPALKSSGDRLKLRISNKLEEVQNINMAELWIVSHPENIKVLPDRHGTIHSCSDPEPPVEALSGGNTDLLPLLTADDRNEFLFDEEPSVTGDTNAFNSATLTFAIPGRATSGKLLIKAGNSLWGDYTYNQFMKLFGNKYKRWIRSQGKVPAEKNISWERDQKFVMMTYLETAKGWQFIDYFDLIGPLGDRELVMSVDLGQALITSHPSNERTIRIRLESGFKFWELDRVAMDFTPDSIFSMVCRPPLSAITESEKNVVQQLLKDDRNYYTQTNVGDEGSLIFKDLPSSPGIKLTYILHAKGYYEHARDFPGPPDIKQLQTFEIPGRLSRFSCDNYQEFLKSKAVLQTFPYVP